MKIFDGPEATAEENMAFDAATLATSEELTLHFYRWKHPSATFGYFIKPEEHLNLGGVALDLARRPTGGGIIFHLCDLAFSVFTPASHPGYSLNTLDNYAFVNTRVSHALERFSGQACSLLQSEDISDTCRHFCMAKPTKYDVMLGGRKVGGGAQRRTKQGFLHQGSINLTLPGETFLRSVLLPNTCVLEAMLKHSCLLIDSSDSLETARSELKQLIIDAFTI